MHRPAPALQELDAEPEPGMAVTEDRFLDWLDRSEGRYEYDRGTVGVMVRVTANHADVVWSLVALLTRQIDVTRYQVFSESFAVRTPASIRFPDVLVRLRGSDGRALETNEPIVIFEVCSPSSLYLDAVVKRDEYLSLPSLQAYVILSQDEPDIGVWIRNAEGGFSTKPVEMSGADAVLKLDAIAATITLGELYRGVR